MLHLRNMPVSIQNEVKALGEPILELHHQFYRSEQVSDYGVI